MVEVTYVQKMDATLELENGVDCARVTVEVFGVKWKAAKQLQ